MVAAIGVALAGIVVVLLGGGSDEGPVPIRVVADPAPRIATPLRVAPPRRAAPAKVPDPALKRRLKGKLEQRDQVPKASVPAHELAAPKAVEVAPEPPPMPPAEVVPPPTPPAVEFGL